MDCMEFCACTVVFHHALTRMLLECTVNAQHRKYFWPSPLEQELVADPVSDELTANKVTSQPLD